MVQKPRTIYVNTFTIIHGLYGLLHVKMDRPYDMVIYKKKTRPRAGAKPQPDPPPNLQTFKFKYIQTHIFNKKQLVA
jgi:hypothetical protein